MKTAIITDSNSGMTAEEGARWDVQILPMPFLIDGKSYLEGDNLSVEDFYYLQENGADIKTSQPGIGDVLDLWDRLLKRYDEIVHIPMTSGLSGSCETAMGLAREYDGKVQVVDNRRISVTQKASVLRAALLRDRGVEARKIKETLEQEASNACIYLAVDDLKYLKKGGRITAAVAAIGSVLNIKPVLQILGGKIDIFAKARGLKKAQILMMEAVEKDLLERFPGKNMGVHVAYAGSDELGDNWRHIVQNVFPGHEVTMSRLPLSIATHTGYGAIGIGAVEHAEDPAYEV